VARQLGVRYVLEGSVRRSAERVRVNAQLIDAQTGNHIWAERYEREIGDIFSVQDEITVAVTTAVLPAVSDAELRRILRKPPESLGAWEAYQRGLWHFGKANATEAEQAKTFFQHSIALDAALGSAYRALANVIFNEATTYGMRSLEEAGQQTAGLLRSAVALDQDDAEAQAMLGACMFLTGNRDEGREQISLALSINSNSSRANFERGATLISDACHSEGRHSILKAIRLDPGGPYSATYLSVLAASYYFERDHESTVQVARRSIARYPDAPRAYSWLAAALGQLGHAREARAALHDLIRIAPTALDSYVRQGYSWRPEDHEHLLDGLRKAGWEG
jgi:adenylate cyclase